MVAFAHEPLVLSHPHEHIQIARRGAHFAGVSSPRDADALTVGDPRRDLHVELALSADTSPAAAVTARLCGHPTVPVADVAGHRANHLSERRARCRLQLATAATAFARLNWGSRLGSVAVAMLAAVDGLIGDLHLHAVGRFDQVYLDRDRDVGARCRPAAAGRARTEEGIE